MNNPQVGQIWTHTQSSSEYKIIKLPDDLTDIKSFITLCVVRSRIYKIGFIDTVNYHAFIASSDWIEVIEAPKMEDLSNTIWKVVDGTCEEYCFYEKRGARYHHCIRIASGGMWDFTDEYFKQHLTLVFKVGQKWQDVRTKIIIVQKIEQTGIVTFGENDFTELKSYKLFFEHHQLISAEEKIEKQVKKIECPSCHFKHENNYLGFMNVECLNPNCQHFKV